MASAGRELPPRASVVIIGGGIMGVSTAYQLAAAGVVGVVLVERDVLGSGSTSKAAGRVRAQFSDPVNIQLGLRSLRTFETFAEQFGQADPDLLGLAAQGLGLLGRRLLRRSPLEEVVLDLAPLRFASSHRVPRLE